MSIREFHWSPTEKKIARKAFDKAYQNEMLEIKNEVMKKLNGMEKLQDIWKLHNYLSQRREEVDRKYDYRYSVLISVFARLFRDGYLKENDFEGLTEEKKKAIKLLAQ